MTHERREPDDAAHPVDAVLVRLAPLLVLAAVAALVALRASDLGPLLEVARLSRAELASDEDLFRSEPILGPESPILARLRSDHPPGTPVSLPLRGASVTRGQRFWIALLPEYPVASDAELVICALPCAEPGLELVERGSEFALMRRRAGGSGAARE